MPTVATLRRRLERIAGNLPPGGNDPCRCPGPVAIIMSGDPAPDRCPRCSGTNPPAVEVHEEIVEANRPTSDTKGDQ